MDHLRKLRHDLRGALNALKLCATVLELPLERDEAVSFLNEIEAACDSIDELTRRLESLPQTCWAPPDEPVSLPSAGVAQTQPS